MKKNKNKKIIRVFFVVIISFFIFFNHKFTFCKFFSQISGQAICEIATPIFQINHGENISITDNNLSGKYCFSVDNYKDDKVSDVNMKYKIKIVNDLDNVDIKLLKNDEEIKLKNGESDYIEFDREKRRDDFRIEVKYNKELRRHSSGKYRIKDLFRTKNLKRRSFVE